MSKILISQKDLHATRAGVPRKVHEEIKFFASKGHQAYAIAERIDKDAVLSSGGTPVKTFRWPISGFYRRINYLKRVEKFVKKNSPDLIIGHGDIVHQDICYIHNCVHLAYELINGKKIPADHEVAKIHEMILKTQDFKVLVCNSQLMKNELTQRFNIPEDKAVVIHPEYNPKRFNLDGAKLRAKKRSELGLSQADTVIGLITSGNWKKRNLDLLIKACAELKKTPDKPFKVLVAGKDKADKYIAKLEDLNLKDDFIFAPSINAVEEYYHAIDIFTLPAHIEEFGRSILEAMGCGLPVVPSNMTGASELIEGESQKFILKEKTPAEYAQKLKALLENPELRKSVGKLNYETAINHTDEARANDFEDLLRSRGLFF